MFFIAIVLTVLSICLTNINASNNDKDVYCVAYYSSDITSAKQFYNKVGIDFIEIDVDGSSHLLSLKSSIVLIETPLTYKSLFGIIHYGSCETPQVVSNDNGLIYSKFPLEAGLVSNRSRDHFAHIIRVEDIEKTKEFFESNGVIGWVKEQHGKGPVHYALENAFGTVIELYPWKKDSSFSTLEHISLGNETPSSLSNEERTIWFRELS